MKSLEIIEKKPNYSIVNIGELEDIKNYNLLIPNTEIRVKGKVFLKDELLATGSEISLATLPAHTRQAYAHKHKKNEEIYLFLKGKGIFEIDDKPFDIKEGSVVRLSPDAKRIIENNSNEELLILCIQAKENSLDEYTKSDGIVL